MTIKDLSRISGYSLGTVSRALNHQPNVSPKARETILALAMQYGYEINANAQSLKKQNSDALLVIVKGHSNVLFASLVEITQRLAAQAGQPLLVDYIDEAANEVHRAIQLIREKKPRAILFFGGTTKYFRQDFDRIPLPSVLVTNSAAGLPFPNLSSVTTDDAEGAFQAASQLIAQGHRTVAVIGGDPEISEISKTRLLGCRKAFAGTNAALCRYEIARFSFESGYQAMGRILDDPSLGVTAVFAMSDVMAVGAMRCIHDRGHRIPADFSVIGFDGLPYAQYCFPRLNTVSQSAEALAKTSFRIIQETLNGAEAKHITVPFTLTEGESIAPVKRSNS